MTTPQLLVVGAVNLDTVFRVPSLPRWGETAVGDDHLVAGGGKAANMAVAAAATGASTRFVGAVGRDAAAEEALADLERLGVDLTAVERVDAPTGAAAVVSGPDDNLIAVSLGANASLDPEHVREQCRRFVEDGGTTVLTSAEARDPVLAAVGREAAAHGLVVVHNAGPARPVVDDLAAAGPLVVVNRVEADQLVGDADVDEPLGAADPESVARALAATYGRAVVTLGGDGAIAVADGRVVSHPAPTIDVVDTTGAGDAFCGALAAVLVTPDDLDAAVAAGVEAGAAAASHAGARGWVRRGDDGRPGAGDVIARQPAGTGRPTAARTPRG